jgi:apolipoprotein N-acyltransferase
MRRLAAVPLLWMATEHARSFVYGGFPWNLTATALYRHPVWLQSASLWGAYGVGGAVLVVSSLLAAAAVRRRLAPLAAAALWVLALGALGAIRLSGRSELSPPVSVALLQPNLHEEDRAADAARTYRVVLVQARQAAERRPGLIVIPESALPAYWETSAGLRRDLSDLAARGSLVLFNDIETTADGRYYNVARLLGPAGLAEPSYRKVHLVPFGEYVPLPRIFFFVRQVSNEIGTFTAASRPELLVSGDLRLGMGVCYEITYPSLVREEVTRGANLLATISNDSWYGRAGAQAQHFAGAVLRSVETGRFLVRAAITGISGIVDDRGRIRGELSADRAGILFGDVRTAGGATAWVRWGYWIPRAADALAFAVLLWGFVRWIRRRRPNAENSTR